ncbi:hydrolase [Sediminibacillus dalangtanensis]|nr:hydrolase [Sediminibacillus dalangtanensis]
MKKFSCAFSLWLTFVLLVPSIRSDAMIDLKDGEVYYAFFHLPDGEATLIRGFNGAILINTGAPSSTSALFDQLKELDVKEINTIILTKQMSDYCGNTAELIDRFHPSSIAYAGKMSKTCGKEVESTNSVKWDTNKLIDLPMGGSLTVLKADETGEMTLDIVYGKTSMLYLSNSSIEDEDDLLQHKLEPQIIKIGDYAQGKSPSGYLLDKIDPHIGIIFTSKDKKPNEGLMERLNESWIDVYQLDQVGTTIIRLNETDYEVLS